MFFGFFEKVVYNNFEIQIFFNLIIKKVYLSY